jgi:hypothetical protein
MTCSYLALATIFLAEGETIGISDLSILAEVSQATRGRETRSEQGSKGARSSTVDR